MVRKINSNADDANIVAFFCIIKNHMSLFRNDQQYCNSSVPKIHCFEYWYTLIHFLHQHFYFIVNSITNIRIYILHTEVNISCWKKFGIDHFPPKCITMHKHLPMFGMNTHYIIYFGWIGMSNDSWYSIYEYSPLNTFKITSKHFIVKQNWSIDIFAHQNSTNYCYKTN